MKAMMEPPEITATIKSVKGWFRALRSSQELMRDQLDEMRLVAQQMETEVIVYNPKAFIAPYSAWPLDRLPIDGLVKRCQN